MRRLLLTAVLLTATTCALATIPAPPLAWTDVDRRPADIRSSYWVDFARSGDPNAAGRPAWPLYRDATGKAQVLGDTVATESQTVLPSATLAFFDSAYQQLLQGGANQ